ncbi:MAG: hypothetical protein EA349_11550, partial [Halomonadaceae bacterium]
MNTAQALQASPCQPIIAVGITSSANARLIDRVLGGNYQLLHDLEQLEGQAPDLLIVDGAALQRHHGLIQGLRRQDEPMILPVLMVSDLKPSPRSGNTELGKTVDDILRIPSTRQELLARIDNLLRLRHLSREQDDARGELAAMVTALRTFNACDQVLVRARSEEALLKSFCQSIIATETYQLAWVSFSQDHNESPPEIHASAGKAAALAESLADEWRGRIEHLKDQGKESDTQRLQVLDL